MGAGESTRKGWWSGLSRPAWGLWWIQITSPQSGSQEDNRPGGFMGSPRHRWAPMEMPKRRRAWRGCGAPKAG